MQLKKIIAGILMLAIGLFASGSSVLAQSYSWWWPNESISVSVSPKTPTGEYPNSGTLQDLGVFRIRAYNGSVRIREISISLNTNNAKGAISSIGLYNNAGSLISREIASFSSQENIAGNQRFTLDVTIPFNDYADIYIKGITRGITSPGLTRIQCSLSTAGGPSIVALGQNGRQIYSYTALTLPLVNIRNYTEGSLNLSKTQATATAIIAIPYRNAYRLSNGGGETVTLNRIEVSSANPNVRILGMALLSDGRNFSRLTYPLGYYDSMNLYLSEWKEKVFIDRGQSKNIEILVYANGITNFQGKIYAARGSRAVEIPFYVTYR
ncbi:MAG: hypothetical protein WCX23_03090 [Candidatus Paceibacterota bacterium]